MAYKAQDFIDAIPGTGGVITHIAMKVGCNWHTAKKYITEYATVAAALEAENAAVNDKAKSNIVSSIHKGNIADSKWWLQVKDPEFTEKQEIKNTGEQTIRVIYDRSEPVPASSDPAQD